MNGKDINIIILHLVGILLPPIYCSRDEGLAEKINQLVFYGKTVNLTNARN